MFALSPTGTGDGVPLMVVGIPEKAWTVLIEGKTAEFDLTKAGLPIKLVLFGAKDHDAAMKMLTEHAANRNEPMYDRRREYFGIDPADGATK